MSFERHINLKTIGGQSSLIQQTDNDDNASKRKKKCKLKVIN